MRSVLLSFFLMAIFSFSLLLVTPLGLSFSIAEVGCFLFYVRAGVRSSVSDTTSTCGWPSLFFSLLDYEV